MKKWGWRIPDNRFTDYYIQKVEWGGFKNYVDKSYKRVYNHTMNDVLTVKEVSEILRVNPYQVYRLIEARKLKAFNISKENQRKYYRIKKSDFDEFMKEREV